MNWHKYSIFSYFHYFCLFLFVSSYPLFSVQLQLNVSAESAILINAETGHVLYEKNAHQKQFPASITKIATALYALKMKGNDLDQIIIAEQDPLASITPEAKIRSKYQLPPYWLETGSTHIGIKVGEELTLKDLLYGMMLASGNDASNLIANTVGGTIPAFMDGVNLYLKEIGCKNTSFCNPHGLHHPTHQTTASDMAIMTRAALKNPIFKSIVQTKRYVRPKTNKQAATTLVQTNKLLRQGPHYYAKAIGVKTGYTQKAQNTFVGAATHEGRTLIAVLLNNKDRSEIFQDAIRLFETAFTQPKMHKILLKAGPQKFKIDLPGASKTLTTYLKNPVAIQYYPAEEPQVKALLSWNQLSLPIKKDQKVGEVRFVFGEQDVSPLAILYSEEEIHATWAHKLGSLFTFSENGMSGKSILLKVSFLTILIVILSGSVFYMRRRQRS